MMSLKLIVLTSCIITIVSFACAQLSGNQYLPPNKPAPPPRNGYNYPTPPVPFTTKPPPRVPGQPPSRNPPPGEPGHVHIPGNPFDFQYSVNDAETANDYSHKAQSDGDVTQGEYRVQLPDGRTQIVRYTADWKTGYHADVSYEGEPQYPTGPAPGGNRPGGGYRY